MHACRACVTVACLSGQHGIVSYQVNLRLSCLLELTIRLIMHIMAMLVDVVHVRSGQLRELFFVLEDDVVAGDKVKAPCTQLGGIVELRGQKET